MAGDRRNTAAIHGQRLGTDYSLHNAFLTILLTATAVTCSLQSRAETVFLVQGFAAFADEWRTRGVANELERGGWSDGGQLEIRRGAVQLNARNSSRAERRFYTLELPTQAALDTQAARLARYAAFHERNHINETLYLVGHSAGGVVARYFMVKHPALDVAALITIASPHRGTELADAGARLSNSPFGVIAELLDVAPLARSGHLLEDLRTERPGTLLYWLNHQEHPQARYISVIREHDGLGRIAVPVRSQDLNRVYALHGRVDTIRSRGPHALSARDGQLLIELLTHLGKA